MICEAVCLYIYTDLKLKKRCKDNIASYEACIIPANYFSPYGPPLIINLVSSPYVFSIFYFDSIAMHSKSFVF